MIGSLAEFIPLQEGENILAQEDYEPIEAASPHITKRRGKSTFEVYTPDDKTNLLVRYERNNIYNINRRKYNQIAKEASSGQRIRKPMVQHHSFFVKPEITKDYIAKQELKRKHNLLRAILRMKQNQEEPNKESDYEQSFHRLYSGFKNIRPQPVITRKDQHTQEEEMLPPQKKILAESSREKSNLGNKKRVEFEHCLSWARKHQKNGDYFAEQLGKNQKMVNRERSLPPNRSLIDEISKKVGSPWAD